MLSSLLHCKVGTVNINTAFLRFSRGVGDEGRDLRDYNEEIWESFLFSTRMLLFDLCTDCGICCLHECFLTIKGLTWQDVVTASSAGPRMGPSDWVEKKTRERKGCGIWIGQCCHSLPWVEEHFPYLPRAESGLLAGQLWFSLMFSCWFSSWHFPYFSSCFFFLV